MSTSFGAPHALYTSTERVPSIPSAGIQPNGHTPSLSREHSSTSPPVTAANGAAGPAPHLRSCVTCRRRKVRCDKRHPCSNCAKAAIDCVFPSPGRAPRKARKPPDTELLARLRRLEGVVQSLGKDVDGNEPEETKAPDVQHPGQLTEHTTNGVDIGVANGQGSFQKEGGVDTKELEKEFGRLVVEEGRSRYVSNSFWASLSDEVAEMKDILDPSDDENYPSPDASGSDQSASHHGFIFSFNSAIVNLRAFHPKPEQILQLWGIYRQNAEPLVKLVHLPSMAEQVLEVTKNLDNLSKGLESLMFAIYLAAVTSLSPDECRSALSEDKEVALSRYRFATEQALARAGFLNTEELIVLKAFVLFLICVRRMDETRFVWTLVGLAIRIAHSLGLHRDGTTFNLSPFETEMRRRLWWQVVLIDIRAAEDQGTDPSITEPSFDTKLPLNINDEDLKPDAVVPPEPRLDCTEQVFCLVRYEVSSVVRRLNYMPPGPSLCGARSMHTLEEQERLIEECHQYIEEKYLKNCDVKDPLHWVTATVARLIMAKMWLVVHHPFKRADCGASLSQETKDRLFVTSVEVIEFSRLLETDASTLKWGWLFRTHIQWYAIAFILSELCTRTKGDAVDRAWASIDSVFADWGGIITASKKGMLWRPLRILARKARAARLAALEKELPYKDPSTLGLPSGGIAAVPPPVHTAIDPLGYPVEQVNMGPVLQQAQPEQNHIDQWILDDATLLEEPGMDEKLDWSGWDDMLRDFQMEVQQDHAMERGPVLGGMSSWW